MMSINREGAPLIWTHNLLKQVCKREKKKFDGEEKKLVYLLGFILSLFGMYLVIESKLKKLLGFLPCGFLDENNCVILCCCACLYFSDLIAYCYDEMMLNV